MSLIRTPQQLADMICSEPYTVAECLHRIVRFGGQARGCSVLNHSLAVHGMVAGQSVSVRLWALLHDCHEILTGDVVRPYVADVLAEHQVQIDRQLQHALCITLLADEAAIVKRADIAVGGYELQKVITGAWVYNTPMPTADWVDAVRSLLDIGRIEASRGFLE